MQGKNKKPIRIDQVENGFITNVEDLGCEPIRTVVHQSKKELHKFIDKHFDSFEDPLEADKDNFR